MSRAGLLLATCCALAIAAPARAYVRESTNWDPSSLPVRYYVNTGTAPSSLGASTAQSAVDAGFASWAAPSCTSWQASDVGTTTRGANASDGQNVILWVSGSWPYELGDVSSVIGVTTPVWYSGGYFSDADIRFNNVGFDWSTTGSRGTVDTQSIATHEEGHFLGLDHSRSSSAVMYASYGGGLKRTLTTDDIDGVCAIYPSGGPPPPPMDAGTSTSDPCSVYNGNCGTCTLYYPCGFCPGTSTCVSGSAGGPAGGSCSGWAWTSDQCGAPGPGMGSLGDPCQLASDCSAGLCIGDGSSDTGICSRICTDDCSCPDGYSCYPTTDPSLRVCAPGARECSGPPPPPEDAGTPPPPRDAGTQPPHDAGTPSMAADAGTMQNDAGGTATDGGAMHVSRDGCGCSAPGRSDRPSFLWLAALAPLLVMRRRRAR